MMLFLQVTLSKQMRLGEESFNGLGSSSPNTSAFKLGQLVNCYG